MKACLLLLASEGAHGYTILGPRPSYAWLLSFYICMCVQTYLSCINVQLWEKNAFVLNICKKGRHKEDRYYWYAAFGHSPSVIPCPPLLTVGRFSWAPFSRDVSFTYFSSQLLTLLPLAVLSFCDDLRPPNHWNLPTAICFFPYNDKYSLELTTLS